MTNKLNSQKEEEIEKEPKLYCRACGAVAELVGRCCNAKVVCSKCGAVWPVDIYEEEIKKIKKYYIKVACALDDQNA